MTPEEALKVMTVIENQVLKYIKEHNLWLTLIVGIFLGYMIGVNTRRKRHDKRAYKPRGA